MIDPENITKYDCSVCELEELALFMLCAAGSNAKGAAKGVDKFLKNSDETPFNTVKHSAENLPEILRQCGIRFYKNKAKSLVALAYSDIDLQTCTVDELDAIHGFGPKTSRFFLLHTRPKQRIACLDRHVLHWLSDQGYKNIPKSTPTGRRYKEIEKLFLDIADKHNVDPAELDLSVWKIYSKKSDFDTKYSIWYHNQILKK